MRERAIAWAAKEGWNPGLHDATTFYATAPQGFFVGEYGGDPVSCISAVAYDEIFGFICFYIVRPEFRGQGLGFKTWQHGMKYLGDRAIGLDGVLAQQDTYRKSGFSLVYRNIRAPGTFLSNSGTNNSLLNTSQVPFEELLAFDAKFFPVTRRSFLQAWLMQTASVCLVKQHGERVVGYGAIRPCQIGWKIGPLFALDAATAEELLLGLVVHTNGETCFLDVPEPNRAAIKLAENYHMTPVFETARMYTKAAPEGAIEGIFGVTTFELG